MSNTPNTKSYWMTKQDHSRRWHFIDLNGQTLGRISTQIAMILMGKTKATYTPSVDCGDFVVAVNAAKIHLTGNKIEQKVAFSHSFYPGGARILPYKKIMGEKPEHALFLSVKRMLPKNRLASRQILRLKIYRGDTHPHQAQQLIPMETRAR